MALVCSISGYPPEDPVISRDGYIFERRLIEKVISDTGLCPITHTALSIADLRPVVSTASVSAMSVDSTSLPSLIHSFEKEWDRVLVESFELKAQLSSAQEDLAKALYEQEASHRLVADLQRERDQAFAEISRLQEELAQMHSVSGK